MNVRILGMIRWTSYRRMTGCCSRKLFSKSTHHVMEKYEIANDEDLLNLLKDTACMVICLIGSHLLENKNVEIVMRRDYNELSVLPVVYPTEVSDQLITCRLVAPAILIFKYGEKVDQLQLTGRPTCDDLIVDSFLKDCARFTQPLNIYDIEEYESMVEEQLQRNVRAIFDVKRKPLNGGLDDLEFMSVTRLIRRHLGGKNVDVIIVKHTKLSRENKSRRWIDAQCLVKSFHNFPIRYADHNSLPEYLKFVSFLSQCSVNAGRIVSDSAALTDVNNPKHSMEQAFALVDREARTKSEGSTVCNNKSIFLTSVCKKGSDFGTHDDLHSAIYSCPQGFGQF